MNAENTNPQARGLIEGSQWSQRNGDHLGWLSFRRIHKLSAILILGLFAHAGCRSNRDAAIFHHWGWEDAKDAKAHLDAYKHVLVACIYEHHWEDRGPHKLTPYRSKATVVRSFKGDWKVSDKIAFVHYVDAPAPPKPTSNAPSGQLVFIFTNEHTDAEIVLETGDFRTYDAESAPALDFIYPSGGKTP